MVLKVEVISTTLKACLGVLPVLLILGLREYYTTFAGVLPEKWYSASGSTPVLNKHGPVPLLREHSNKSGIVLLGVLLNKLKLYTGSDLDMICNLDILLPLDTLGVLPLLLFLVSGSTLNTSFYITGTSTDKKKAYWENSQKPKIKVLRGLPERSVGVIYQDYSLSVQWPGRRLLIIQASAVNS